MRLMGRGLAEVGGVVLVRSAYSIISKTAFDMEGKGTAILSWL